jgi:type I restriction enzyme S subunit
MTQLPEGWRKKKLGEIADTQLGKMLNKSKQSDSRKVPYLRTDNVHWGRIDLNLVKEMEITPDERDKFIAKTGDLLVCEGGASGRTAIWNLDYEIGIQNHLHRVRTRGEVSNKYLMYYMEWLVKNGQINHLIKGVTISHLSQSSLRSIDICYPGIYQQNEIVELLEYHLSRLDAAVADVKQARTSLEVLEKSLLNKYFLIDPTKGNVLGDVAKIVDCEHKTAPRAEADGFAHSLGTSSIRNGVIDFNKAKPISEATYELWTSRQRPESGDLILTREAPVGEVAVIPEGVRCALGQRTVLIHIDRKRVSPKYLYYLLRSPILRKWMESNSLGTTVLHLNVADVKKIPLGELPGLNEQELIVENYFSTHEFLNVRKDLLNPVVAQGESLRRSLLEASFTGQLTKEVVNV